jgi:hypothetical protein
MSTPEHVARSFEDRATYLRRRAALLGLAERLGVDLKPA